MSDGRATAVRHHVRHSALMKALDFVIERKLIVDEAGDDVEWLDHPGAEAIFIGE